MSAVCLADGQNCSRTRPRISSTAAPPVMQGILIDRAGLMKVAVVNTTLKNNILLYMLQLKLQSGLHVQLLSANL